MLFNQSTSVYKQQDHLSGSQPRDCVQMTRRDETLGSCSHPRPGLPYTELGTLLPGDFCVKNFFLTKNLAFEDVVFIWDFVHHCQDCNIKNHTGHW